MSTQRAVKSESNAKHAVPATRRPADDEVRVVGENIDVEPADDSMEELDELPVPPKVTVAAPSDAVATLSKELGIDLGDDVSGKLMREDPALDRRIIEGMLNDRNVFLEQMNHEGYGAAAILRRAAELGLSEALVRQVKGVAADLAGERPGRRPAPSSLGARTCLCCDRVFLSSGPGNRLCMRCRGGDAGLAQL